VQKQTYLLQFLATRNKPVVLARVNLQRYLVQLVNRWLLNGTISILKLDL